jgi:perosamine synthetase
MKIPQYDLDGLGGEFLITQDLEKLISEFFGVKHCVMVTSGTAAIFLALRACGSKKVAVPDLTMIATATASELANCDIVLTHNNEIPSGVDTYIHVSLNGRDNDIEKVIKSNPGVIIIEDACQSFGSKFNNKYIGTFGKVGCFSFSPHKILSAGNGGCIITNDDEIAKNVKRLKNFGRESGGADQHDFIGYNFKFTDIQAKFVIEQFPELNSKLRRKIDIYKKYYDRLSKIMLPHAGVPWFVDIYVDDRDSLHSYLASKDVGTRKMYPLISSQPPFLSHKTFGDSRSDLDRSKRGLWLPSSGKLSDDEIDHVIELILDWLK